MEMYIVEYNTVDLVKDNTKKTTTVLLYFFFVPSSLKCKRKAKIYYSSPGAI
jgi:hypothetical protein